ncbi:adenylosuccinate lyase [Acetohalobium arabaticum]|uniref:Adenylosuccinate lyase n=1 Tax=Acetohalobium arabaticum (strain ATCC 49924 / DSM 5501 / Z-7288) TaxID=574087 RepID=D9QUK4_ACEAZ|nr:adenylosuccinate lyase [Acetohalobium arabaticum]ADL13805.1 Adenylosuccinate lyase [Acetohalobium arabaticum DSM 5501]
MIDRYTLSEMEEIWSEENKFNKWLDIELAVCEALAEVGQIPDEDVAEMKDKADFTVDRIKEIEQETKHDVLAFLTAVAESLGEESKYIHLGLTSSDIKDTARSLQLKESAEIILQDLEEATELLGKKAVEYKDQVMIGRTHGIHAEPITFGLKLANWYSEMERNIERFRAAKERISYGKISGAVGTFANITPEVEEITCNILDLKPAPISSQILQRDRHAEYISTLGVIAGSLDRFATEIRNLQRTDILEVEESFKQGQKGSSAMPHKKNPITCERISGLARVVRSNSTAAFENQPLWHERDLTHSSVERIIFPDSSILIDYMLTKFKTVLKQLDIYEDNMMENLEKTNGLIFSQKVMLELVDQGLLRDDAYELVQRNALKAWEGKKHFKDYLVEDEEILDYLTEDEIERIFDYDYHLKNIDKIFVRLGLE